MLNDCGANCLTFKCFFVNKSVLACPEKTMHGTESNHAAAKPVIEFVTPGPCVTTAQPIVLFTLASLVAASKAACS